jgi:hypothetical protein
MTGSWTPLGAPVNANLYLVGIGQGASGPFGLSSASYSDNSSDGNNGISDEQWIHDGLADVDAARVTLLEKSTGIPSPSERRAHGEDVAPPTSMPSSSMRTRVFTTAGWSGSWIARRLR